MKLTLAIIGGLVVVLSVLGTFEIGHFRLYYGFDPSGCGEMERSRGHVKEKP